ncbi:hypothetical protein TNIN_376771 [Trichonephila inaurata madagascariensis]|uniref:Uncharacterized protein n=1 Tax=Trichonephila inaurata madagascariensis TaxID=2747483 RepID=A0A8X6XFY5_9ARAC|nr:hypothetical protein TNIN_376771 [Trichonephila inaurata madagascariensis]
MIHPTLSQAPTNQQLRTTVKEANAAPTVFSSHTLTGRDSLDKGFVNKKQNIGALLKSLFASKVIPYKCGSWAVFIFTNKKETLYVAIGK